MNTSQTTTAVKFIRKMRGAAQAHLLKADDGHVYTVKFSNNPQHRRILVNEFISSAVLRHLRIATPVSAIVRITDDFLSENPEVYFKLRSGRRSVIPGCHFGSRYPVDVENVAVYDSLPDALVDRVLNVSDFLGAYVADRWLANSNAPKFVFFRAPNEGQANLSRFVMQSISHGGAFEGAGWRFPDPPSLNMDSRPRVYQDVTSIQSFQPWLDEITKFPESAIEEVREQIPEEWLEGEDASQLKVMLEKLVSRRTKVADLIGISSRYTMNPFPNWKKAA